MKESFENESLHNTQEISEAVKNAFKRLSERLKGRDIIFTDKDSGEQRFLALVNPAGNLSIHSYKTGNDYLLGEDGEIQAISTSEPDKIVDSPSSKELNAIVDEIDTLSEQELPEEPTSKEK